MPKQFVQLSLAAADLLVLQKFQNRPHQYGRQSNLANCSEKSAKKNHEIPFHKKICKRVLFASKTKINVVGHFFPIL